VALSTIGNIETGRFNAGQEMLEKLAAALESTIDKLLAAPPASYKGLPHRLDIPLKDQLGAMDFRLVPIVSYASAGAARDYQDLAGQIDEAVESTVKDPNAFALIVEGHSMETEILAGDVVVFAPNTEARNGDIVVAKLREEEEVLIKRFRRTGKEGTLIRLESSNPDYAVREHEENEFSFFYPAYELKRQLRR
jgi:SOS-response transcriptional repressor LexA